MSKIAFPPSTAIAGKLLLVLVAFTLTACSSEAKRQRLACANGDAAECNTLGLRLYQGDHVLQDRPRAAGLFEQACDGGVAEGCYHLGRMHQESGGIVGDSTVAVSMYRRACDGAEMRGCTSLGVLYRDSVGVPQDLARAVSLFQQACDGDGALGCANLGNAYGVGEGVTQDLARAAGLFEQACDGDVMVGCTRLGDLLAAGEGVSQDLDRAVALYREACDADSGVGCSSSAARTRTAWASPRIPPRPRACLTEAATGDMRRAASRSATCTQPGPAYREISGKRAGGCGERAVGDTRRLAGTTEVSVDTLLTAEHLTKHYGNVVALDDVRLGITDGITGLLGENGAGKSTAIKIFLGLLQPTAGSATILGENASESVTVRAKLGYMPEHDCLPTSVTAAEFLTHMAEVSGLPPSQARTRAADTLRHAGLFEERYRSMGGYSTGMKQRVKLAQALVHDPAIVFLDEPTAGLDPGGREEMLELVRKTHREFGISILLSSHLMADVERTCDRIIVLQSGRVVQSGEVEQFTRETEHLFIEVDTNLERLVSALEQRGVAVAVDGHGLSVEGDESVYDHVRDALVDAEAPLRRMAPRRRALTELFQREGDDFEHGVAP